jgi:hypothetical protein
MQGASSPVGEDTEARPHAADAEVGEGRSDDVFRPTGDATPLTNLD